MSFVVVAGLSFVVIAGACLTLFGQVLLLRLHHAIEVQEDQAPAAHTALRELAAAAEIRRPRLFVLPGSDPNGVAVGRRGQGAIAITEGAFDVLGALELRGLLALLVATLVRSHPLALVRSGFSAGQWFAIDRTASDLAGNEPVKAALAALDRSAGHRSPRGFGLPWMAPWAPGGRAATPPTFPSRIARLDSPDR